MAKFYRELAKQIHPDKNSHPLANKVFQKISQAYQSVMKKIKERDIERAYEKQQSEEYQNKKYANFAYQAYFGAFNSNGTVY